MGTEEDIVESQEEQEKDFHAAEMQERTAVETENSDSFTSHTDQSLKEEQEKWTQAEEIDE